MTRYAVPLLEAIDWAKKENGTFENVTQAMSTDRALSALGYQLPSEYRFTRTAAFYFYGDDGAAHMIVDDHADDSILLYRASEGLEASKSDEGWQIPRDNPYFFRAMERARKSGREIVLSPLTNLASQIVSISDTPGEPYDGSYEIEDRRRGGTWKYGTDCCWWLMKGDPVLRVLAGDELHQIIGSYRDRPRETFSVYVHDLDSDDLDKIAVKQGHALVTMAMVSPAGVNLALNLDESRYVRLGTRSEFKPFVDPVHPEGED